MSLPTLPALGGGLGLRHEHLNSVLEERPTVSWFEIIVENFLDFGGFGRERLKEVSLSYPVIPHGVCLSIGSTDPLDVDFLKRQKVFLDEIKAPWSSDHLCFTMVDHTNLNDLIPLPFNKEAVDNVVARVKIVQDIIERPFLLENVTRYITVSDREMNEITFLNEILERADCGLLLDITNVYLNSEFHKFDPREFISALPLKRVGQIHLSGWEQLKDGSFIDSHDAPVPKIIWDLYSYALSKIGPTSALVEWDSQIPPLSRLVKEAQQAETLMKEATSFQPQDYKQVA